MYIIYNMVEYIKEKNKYYKISKEKKKDSHYKR